MSLAKHYDVVILGGGLAGLCLSIQLKRKDPELKILVLEKNKHPLPEAAHKVGEALVESSSYYLSQVVGLKKILEEEHLEKLNLRFFFSYKDNSDITKRIEIGAIHPPQVKAYLIDRGRFENSVGKEATKLGIEFLDNCKVQDVSLSPENHSTTLLYNGEEVTVSSRWVIDASGNTAIIKRKLGLAKEVTHKINSAWFRIGHKIRVDDFSDDPKWQAKVKGKIRWSSTNHFMGEGYWVWFIPLSSGSISIGISADPQYHDFKEMNRFEKALEWLKKYEPQCAKAVEEHKDKLQDFHVLRHFSQDCTQLFSADRWAITGVAGEFNDPLYSSGFDRIAFANTFIVNLILKDRKGEDISEKVKAINQAFANSFKGIFLLFENQYPIMGNSQVMATKIIYDTCNYWGTVALLYLHDKVDTPQFFEAGKDVFMRSQQLQRRMQSFFREWASLGTDWPGYQEPHDGFINYCIDFLQKLHEGMMIRRNDEELLEALKRNVELNETFAAELFRRVSSIKPELWNDENDLLVKLSKIRTSIPQDLALGLNKLWKALSLPWHLDVNTSDEDLEKTEVAKLGCCSFANTNYVPNAHSWCR